MLVIPLWFISENIYFFPYLYAPPKHGFEWVWALDRVIDPIACCIYASLLKYLFLWPSFISRDANIMLNEVGDLVDQRKNKSATMLGFQFLSMLSKVFSFILEVATNLQWEKPEMALNKIGVWLEASCYSKLCFTCIIKFRERKRSMMIGFYIECMLSNVTSFVFKVIINDQVRSKNFGNCVEWSLYFSTCRLLKYVTTIFLIPLFFFFFLKKKSLSFQVSNFESDI